jgi:hypothetical protein
VRDLNETTLAYMSARVAKSPWFLAHKCSASLNEAAMGSEHGDQERCLDSEPEHPLPGGPVNISDFGVWLLCRPARPTNGKALGFRGRRIITPGSSAGELLHVLSPLERRSDRWDGYPEAAKSRGHVLLSVLAKQTPATRRIG